ncbi:MAG: CRTAC1 family protein, partial [bacterium]
YHDMLFRNEGGVFKEIAAPAGVAGAPVWSSSSIFFDADRDGWLDLYVGNYVEWSPEKDLWCTLDGKTKSYCTPELYKGVPGRFYHNNGDGTFTDRTEAAGFGTSPGKSLGVAELDYNRDGWPDLAVANDTQRNLLYKNNGDGTFSEIAAMSGVAYDENGRARAGMGIDVGVVDRSEQETIFVGNFSKEMIAVFHYTGDDLFTDRAATSKIGRPSLLSLTFGLFLFDFDFDGDLDLFAANGHVQEDIEITQDGITYREPAHLFANDGNGFFTDEAPNIGGVLRQPIVGRGAAYADYDRDGDLDVLVTENGGPAHLWQNELQNGNHFLRVHVQGHEGNRDGIGTRVVAFADSLRMERRIRTGSSFLASSEMVATFGLGPATQVDSLIVYWLHGRVDRFANIKADRDVLLIEGSNELLDFAKPAALAVSR